MAGLKIRARWTLVCHSGLYQRCVVALICVTLAGIVLSGRYQMVPHDATRRFATYSASGRLQQPITHQTAGPRLVHVSVPVDVGDRLIVSSLDETVRLHEIRISQTVRPPGSRGNLMCDCPPGVDLCRTQSCGLICNDCSRPNDDVRVQAVENTDIGSHRASDYGERSLISHLTRSERPFRLPWLSAYQEDRSTTTHYSDRIAICRQVAGSNPVRVYTAGLELSARRIEHLITIIQDVILPSVTDQLGPIADIDGDGCLSVVLCELSDNQNDTESPVLGCVYAPDFFLEGPLHGDIIYLDYRLLASAALPAVVLHELTHAAVFSHLRKLRLDGYDINRLPVWLNEAIAHSCEYQMYPESPNLADRISAYLRQPGQWPLMLAATPGRKFSGRGPMRAAGMFYVEFLRQAVTLRQLIDRELLVIDPDKTQSRATFAESFRRWTVWMSDRQQAGQLPLRIRSLPCGSRADQISVRGTAATWWHCKDPGIFTITTGCQCALQVTIVKAQHEPLTLSQHNE